MRVPDTIEDSGSRRKTLLRRLLIAVQITASAVLLGWIFRSEDFRREVVTVLLNADPAWLLAGVAVAGVGSVLGILRWAIYLRMLGIYPGLWDTLRMGFVGLFFNNFSLGTVGGDAVKVIWLASRGHARSACLLSILMDRMSGLGALVLCSLVFVVPRLQWLTSVPAIAPIIHFIFIFLGGICLFSAASFVICHPAILWRLPTWIPARAGLIRFSDSYGLFLQKWPSTLAASLISVVMLLAYFLTFYCSARAFGANVPLMDFMAIMPAVDILAALPVSLGGLGVREQTFVLLLGHLSGVAAQTAVSISFSGAFLSLLWGCVGLLLLPSYRRSLPAEKLS